ncbi:MAG: hypothetical protein A3G41_02840 [Elusimicrobia bacterium RIFCSPLOWO2_12_FULL_59_9]|nr:hypothetical protein [Elusimicrobiota bacterium]OGS01879.1 MAG: hypothetical protein A3G41_02840 [Elusimicrobia bacterium RIFCSPLOWO2_12_FULL_59_9]
MAAETLRKVKVRGLARLASLIFGGWGILVGLKGLYDVLWGEPEANIYAPQPWGFVSKEAWLRYGGFETVYGLACAALALCLWRYSRLLPETVERPPRPPSTIFLND